MSVEIKIPEKDLSGFSEQARQRLKEAVAEYASDLIEETNRIEAGRNSTTGPPEVTRGMVNDAKLLLRRGLGTPRKSWKSKLLRIAAAVLMLLVGLIYDPSKFQDTLYLLMFIVVLTAAIFFLILSTLQK